MPAGTDAEQMCRDIASRMRLRPPGVLRSPFLSSPCLDGVRRPAILLPEDQAEDLREVFVHELAHLLRRDGLWNLLRRSAAAAFWFQPLLWVLSRRLETVAEEVCDDFVVHFGATVSVAGQLVELAARTLPPPAPAAVGMIALRSMLGRRVGRILDTSRLISTRAGKQSVAAMITLGLTGTLLASLLGIGQAKQAATARGRMRPGRRRRRVGTAPRSAAGWWVRTGSRCRAKVTASRVRPGWAPEGIGDGEYSRRPYEIVQKSADADGRFAIGFEPVPAGGDGSQTQDAGMVIATAPGFGLGYRLGDQPIRLTRAMCHPGPGGRPGRPASLGCAGPDPANPCPRRKGPPRGRCAGRGPSNSRGPEPEPRG